MLRLGKTCLALITLGFLICVAERGHTWQQDSQTPDPKQSQEAGKGLAGATETLKNLGQIDVVVFLYAAPEDVAGLSKEEMQTDVELRLREAGIKEHLVLNPIADLFTKRTRSPGEPFLWVEVEFAKPVNGLVAWLVRVELKQNVILERDPQTKIVAVTWGAQDLGTVGKDNLRQIRDVVKDYVDKFCNDYLAANPKK